MTTVDQKSKLLPAEFAQLQEWESWIEWDESARAAHLVATPLEDVTAFYRSVFPHAGRIHDHLASVPLDDMSDENSALLCLAIALAETANTAEIIALRGRGAPADTVRFVPRHDSIVGWKR